MLIDIQDDLFHKMLKIVKSRNSFLYNQLIELQPIDILADARAVKTDRTKYTIKTTIQELIKAKINPTKYQVHKRTNIAYVTLNKYYDDILAEVQNEQ